MSMLFFLCITVARSWWSGLNVSLAVCDKVEPTYCHMTSPCWGGSSIEDKVVVPLPVSILPTVLPHKVGWWAMQDMEMCKEEEYDSTNRTELSVAVPDGPMLVHTTVLVVFRIVCKDSENLSSALSSVFHTLTTRDTGQHTSIFAVCSKGTAILKRSDHCSMREFSPQNAVVEEKSSITWSHNLTKMDCMPEKSASAQREHLLSSSMYESAAHTRTAHHMLSFSRVSSRVGEVRLTGRCSHSLDCLGFRHLTGFVVLQGRLEHTDVGVLSQRCPCLVIGWVLMLMVEPVLLQGIDDLGNV